MKQFKAALLISLASCSAASTVNTRILKGKSQKDATKEHPLKYHEEDHDDIQMPLFIASSMSLPEVEPISMPTDPEFGEWGGLVVTDPVDPEIESTISSMSLPEVELIQKPIDPEFGEWAAQESPKPVDADLKDWAVVEVPADPSMAMTEPLPKEWGTFDIDMSLSLSFSLSLSMDGGGGGSFVPDSKSSKQPSSMKPKSGKGSSSPVTHAPTPVGKKSTKSSKSAPISIASDPLTDVNDRGEFINSPLLVSSGSIYGVGIASFLLSVVSAMIWF